ncbi:MurR/RpiR family transcriptional regulator [Aeromicrobium chenweiae]|uniref:SIS domain-containing protein n=1 Tax=Aeromicrobium chenweiae TaxID=2079793 RepID=A0A2S0WHT8_9ACTN|nr:SIS domain-containing protein [Aeromicrobium chenweiae]AWB90905.1 SIS domain-containing protein [Aeromicrobium chenweiae]TGN32124.1 MurR/RpiR family transcriptional regulator [Aeromicrobium chenweiae]
MSTRPDGTRAPRSATILKARLIDAHREEFDAGLLWALSDPAVENAAARITGARRRFVLGAATSFTYASLLAAKLSNALAQVILVDGTIVRPLDILSDVRASDVMIVISFRRYRSYTIDTALPFAQAGGSLVLVTDSADNPLAEHAAETIVIGGGTAERDGVAGELSMHPETPDVSPAVVAMVIDLLATLSSASAKGANRRFAERQRLASELGLHRD